MEFKSLALIVIIGVSSAMGYSFEARKLQLGNVHKISTINQGTHGTDFGPQIQDAINNLVKDLPDPTVVISSPITLNLTVLTGGLNIKVDGTLEISAVNVTGLPTLEVFRSTAILDGILRPFPFDIAVKDPSLKVVAGYKLDILIEDVIPIWGVGQLTLDLEGLELGIAGNITNLISKLTLGDFDFGLQVEQLKLVIDGLLDDPDFSETLSRVLGDLLTKQLLQPIQDPSNVLHSTIVDIAKELFNGLELTLSDLLDLLNPKPSL